MATSVRRAWPKVGSDILFDLSDSSQETGSVSVEVMESINFMGSDFMYERWFGVLVFFSGEFVVADVLLAGLTLISCFVVAKRRPTRRIWSDD